MTILIFLVTIGLALDLVVGSSTKAIRNEWRQAPERRYRVDSNVYHHGLRANMSVDDAVWGRRRYAVRTNSLGFKSRSTGHVPLGSQRYRMLFIGDSTTEGSGVSYPETFVGLIDTALAGRGVEVLNAAAVSYSPIIYWRKVKYLIEDIGLQFDELIVVIDISDVEDEAVYYTLDDLGRVVSKAPPRRWEGIPNWLMRFARENTLLVSAAGAATRDLFWSNYEVGHRRALWTLDERRYQEYGRRGLESAQRHMSHLFDLLEEHGIRLTVAVTPWPDQIFAGDLDSLHVRFWRQWSEARGVRFLDYFPDFVVGATPAERLKVVDEYFIYGDVHFNEKGHRLVADVFLSRFRDEVPNERRSNQSSRRRE